MFLNNVLYIEIRNRVGMILPEWAHRYLTTYCQSNHHQLLGSQPNVIPSPGLILSILCSVYQLIAASLSFMSFDVLTHDTCNEYHFLAYGLKVYLY